jgi:hypothetical protein
MHDQPAAVLARALLHANPALLMLANTPVDKLAASAIDDATFAGLNAAAATILHQSPHDETLRLLAERYWQTRAADAVARAGHTFVEGLAAVAGLEPCPRCGRRYAESGHQCNHADAAAYAVERAVRAIQALNAGERATLDEWMLRHETWGQQIVRRIAYDVSQNDRDGLATRCRVLLIAGLLGAQGASPNLMSEQWSAQLTAALSNYAAWLDGESDLEAIAVQTFLEAIPAQSLKQVRTTLLLLVGCGWTMGLTQTT